MSSDQLRSRVPHARIAIHLCLHASISISAVAFGIIAMSVNASQVGQPDRSRLSPDAARKSSSPCSSCHEQIVQAFTSNPHAKIAWTSEQHGDACNACHGSGEPHIASGGQRAKILSFSDTPPGEIDRVCMRCHSNTLREYTHSAHGVATLSCISCHNVHGAGKDLLKEAQPKLCLSCHSGVMPSFSFQSHHPVSEGRIKCTDCHNPHGVDAETAGSLTLANATCTKCHTQQAGPFAFEHKAIPIEGCISCHSPHGSERAKLLKQVDINSMCQLCHSATGSISHAEKMRPAGHADGRTAQKVCCIDCHTHFHGSNADKDFLK